ncbi:hypothetical protein SAMN06265376_105309 [Dokdonia pacifica]|uniref:Uncharacterized protein n=1 Tax=Dokdonia pacifica TaxID=1627892 RepID=A0A239B2R7_9FLAO|nr:hypothetical protein SAMN06265376_105309 [Dokdonia pacifica]
MGVSSFCNYFLPVEIVKNYALKKPFLMRNRGKFNFMKCEGIKKTAVKIFKSSFLKMV